MLKYLKISVLLVMLTACSTEQINLLPLSGGWGNHNGFVPSNTIAQYKETTKSIGYASQLSNLLSSLPKFGNEEVDREISLFKNNTNEYLYSWKNNDLIGMEKALDKVKKSYESLYLLKDKLSKDDGEVLNRYLVRIKTTINMLESEDYYTEKDSLSLK